MRDGLREILTTEGDIDVVGEAVNGRQAVQMTGALGPDVVVMDVSMPHLNGLEAMRQIHAALPRARVLILSAHNDPAYVEQAAAMGAAGYITKQTAGETLTAAIRDIHRGDTVFGPGFSAKGKRRGTLPGQTHLFRPTAMG
jgi:DNA-binding NarL/FixJ family response regulator